MTAMAFPLLLEKTRKLIFVEKQSWSMKGKELRNFAALFNDQAFGWAAGAHFPCDLRSAGL